MPAQLLRAGRGAGERPGPRPPGQRPRPARACRGRAALVPSFGDRPGRGRLPLRLGDPLGQSASEGFRIVVGQYATHLIGFGLQNVFDGHDGSPS